MEKQPAGHRIVPAGLSPDGTCGPALPPNRQRSLPVHDAPIRTGLPPVVRYDATILILGSLPGEQSLAQQQYYAHPQNQFWRIIGVLTGCDLVSLPYPQRLSALYEHGIALWDVVASAKRHGSLDQDIRAAQLNDVAAVVDRLPDLRLGAFNGQKAAALGKALTVDGDRIPMVTLPSTSPAHTMSFSAKLAAWQAALTPVLIKHRSPGR